MAFSIIVNALNKKNSILLLAKKQKETWLFVFAFASSARSFLVYIKGR